MKVTPDFMTMSVNITLERAEAERLMALLRMYETSGSKPPGSTLFTALAELGLRSDEAADVWLRNVGRMSIVTEQGETYWDSPTGQQHASDLRLGLREL